MFTQPKKTKYFKHQRNRGCMKGNSQRGHRLAFGDYGLKITTRGELTARQLEAARRTITNATKRQGKVWLRVFTDKVVTAKGAEVPMGSGKGGPDHWVAPLKPGRILFEIDGVSEDIARDAFKKAGAKLPFKTKFVTQEII